MENESKDFEITFIRSIDLITGFTVLDRKLNVIVIINGDLLAN